MGSQKEEVKLLSFVCSPVCRRVEWGLRLKGVDYEYIEEDIFNKSNLLLQLNPLHKKVPVLVHANKPIAESLVILEYVDETWNHQYPLLPQHPYERALTRFWIKFADEKVMYGGYVAMISSGDEQEKKVNEVREGMEKLEELIKGKRFFGGDKVGFLDIALGWITYLLPVWEEVGCMKILEAEKCPAISAWVNNILSHPVFKDCLPPKEELLAYNHRRRKHFNPALYN
ncbi:hypothetical protein PIB30_022301 [Stylosanthes scabra]|uniref:glutathione transferase n=1 Tax=Stylosanthes scabra TaxID=79078 RepID=A0ABU6U921_9FABA|nr:hypothetical protein [Stylosanthes scabra]